ncbi:MAG: GNAT family N-acetyltransferase [Candidatus Dormibacteria bacterium]
MQLTVRPFDGDGDFQALVALWAETLDTRWPVSEATLRSVLGNGAGAALSHLVAEADGQRVAFAGVVAEQGGDEAALLVLLVQPAYQRHGIGRALVDAALAQLRLAGVAGLRLGGGAHGRLWPGVPENLPDAVTAFRSLGWSLDETCDDLLSDLSGCQAPDAIALRLASQEVVVSVVDGAATADLLSFEDAYFPFWSPEFRLAVNADDGLDILGARDQSGRLIGSLLMSSAETHRFSPNRVWRRSLGDSLAGIGCVGVDPDAQGRGIGIGMVAKATEILRSRGAGQCLVDWVTPGLLDFYGRLGFIPWRRYRLGTRSIP